MLQQAGHGLVARSYLVDSLQPLDLFLHWLSNRISQPLAGQILLDWVHPNRERVLMLSQEGVDTVANFGVSRQRNPAALNHLGDHCGGETEAHLGRQQFGIVGAFLIRRAAGNLLRDGAIEE